MKRKLLSLLLAVMLLQSCLVFESLAAAAPIIYEGEDYTRTNYAPKTNDTKCEDFSGGECLLYSASKTAIPADGFIVQYKVYVEEAGAYNINFTANKLSAAHLSPYEIRVNRGDYIKVDTSTAVETGNNANTSLHKNIFYCYKMSGFVFNKGVNSIYFRVTEPRSQDGAMYFFLDCFYLEKESMSISALDTGMPNNILEEKDEQKIAVKFNCGEETPHKLTYTLTDFFGNVVASATDADVPLKASSYPIELKGKLPRGHYTLRASLDGGEEFMSYMSVVMNSDERTPGSGEFYGVDTAATYFYANAAAYEPYLRALKLAGVEKVRDRLNWHQVESQTEGLHPNAAYEEYKKLYEKYDMKVLMTLAGPPAWGRTEPGASMADDLRRAYNYGKWLSTNYDADRYEWEVSNEPSIVLVAGATADDYMAYVKSLALGIKDGNPNAKAYSAGTVNKIEFDELQITNEIFEFLDGYSYHEHTGDSNRSKKTHEFPGGPVKTFNLLEDYAMETYPVYDTESGFYTLMNKVSGRPDLGKPSNDEKLRSYTSQANYALSAPVQAYSQGTDQFAWFVWGFYLEQGGNIDWAAFGPDGIPYPAYNTISALTHELSGARYAGTVDFGDAYVRAYCFKSGEENIVIFWSEDEKSVKLTTDADTARLIDLMGNGKEITASNGGFELVSNEHPQYLRFTGSLDALVPEKLPETVSEPVTITDAQHVVLNQRIAGNLATNAKLEQYILDPAKDYEVQVQVYNFNSKPMTGIINSQSFNGWEVTPASAEVSLAAGDRQTLTFKLTGGDDVAPGEAVPLVFTGDFDGDKTTRSYTHITSDKEVKANKVLDITETGNVDKWTENASGTMTMTSGGADVLDVEVQFGAGDKWVYPYFEVNETDLSDSVGICYELYVDEEVLPADFTHVFLTEQNGSTYLSRQVMGLTPGWNQIYMPWGGFSYQSNSAFDPNLHINPDETAKLQIGMNTKRENLKYSIRNVGTYKLEASDIIRSTISDLQYSLSGNTATVSAVLTNNKIAVDETTIEVAVNGIPVPHTYTDGVITAQCALTPGGNKVVIRALDVSGRAVACKTGIDIE